MTPNDFIKAIWNHRTMNGSIVSRMYLLRTLGDQLMFLFDFNKDIIMDDASYLKINDKPVSIEQAIALKMRSVKVFKYDKIKHIVYFNTEFGLASNDLICFKSNT